MVITPIAGGTSTQNTPSNQYIEIYWDDSVGKKYFVVSSIRGTSGNMEPLTVPGYLANSAIIQYRLSVHLFLLFALMCFRLSP